MSYELVKKISAENLKMISKSGIPVFDGVEADFLMRFAPYTFGEKNLSDVILAKEGRCEVAQIIFGGVVKVDTVVENAILLGDWLIEYSRKLNPVFKTLGIPEIDTSQKEIHIAYQIKTNCFDALTAIMQDVKYEVATRDASADAKNYSSILQEITKIIGPVPVLIFGSYLTESKPGDIDVRVFPQKISQELYTALTNKKHQIECLPLDLMIIPEQYMIPFFLADNWSSFMKEKSVILRGPINYPITEKAHFDKIKLADVAVQCIRARSYLTPAGLSGCKGILKRINSVIKKPKYMRITLEEITGEQMENPEIKKFTALPTDSQLIDAFVKSNLEFNKIISVYSKYL